MAADFHHLFVTDHQHVLFMSEFPHLESGRGTVLASQSPPPRPNKETSSQQRAGPESGRACLRAGSFQVCVCSADPAETPLGLPGRKCPQGCPRGNGPRRCSSGPRVSKSIPHLDREPVAAHIRVSWREGVRLSLAKKGGGSLGEPCPLRKGRDSTGLPVILAEGKQE